MDLALAGPERRFAVYSGAVVALAAALLVGGAAAADWTEALGSETLWVFVAFMVAGEFLPIRVPRSDGFEEVTISGAFAVAMLLLFGFGVAAAVCVAASLASSAVYRIAPAKAAFNAGQYVLSLGAAAGVLSLLGDPAPLADVADALPPVVAAVCALFFVENVLIEGGLATLRGEPVLHALTRDIGFHAWTAGALLVVGPLLATAAQDSVWLVPLAFAPILAIYLGGRQAVISRDNALHDPLTGLPNRSLFAQRLAAALEAADARAGTVALTKIDLRDFRTVNETLGHEQGDTLLRAFAARLQNAVTPDESLARIGSDEFAVISSCPSPDTAVERAAAIADALSPPFELRDLVIDVPAYLGIALYPYHADGAEALMKRADVALDRAKHERVGSKIYSAEFDESSPNRLALATELRRGIDRGELVLYYQPKLPLRADGEYGVEALVRWRHPQLGLLGPNAFVPLAEHTGLIRPLTEWVLETAVRQCAEWHASGLAVRVSVNLSPQSLLDSGLPPLINGLLGESGLDPTALQLEITERGIIGDLLRGKAILAELAETGITSAIDDFGTGYASLAHLQALPVSEIKIDRSFVSRMISEPQSAAIVASTIGLGRSLSLAITAEGVETEQEMARLEELGCDFVQGFYVSRPVPADECRQLLDAHDRRQSFASVQ